MPATVVSQATVRVQIYLLRPLIYMKHTSHYLAGWMSQHESFYGRMDVLAHTQQSFSKRMDVPAHTNTRVILWQDGCPSTHTAVIL